MLSFVSILGTAVAFFALCGAVPRDHVVHEKREIESLLWRQRGKVEPHAVLPVRIGLTQNNLDQAFDYLYDVSDPESPNYGKHWTSEEVISKFAPSESTVKAVYAWLEASGIHPDRVFHHDNKGWLVFDARADEMERLVHTEFHEFEHEQDGHISIGCNHYHLPTHIQPHVDYITPGIKLSATIRKREINTDLHRRRYMESPEPTCDNPNEDPEDLSNCDTKLTPACIRALYQFSLPTYKEAHPNNTFGVYQTAGSFYNGDQNAFFTKYAPHIPNGTHPISLSIDGGIRPSGIEHANPEGELDIQVAYPVIYPQKIIWYQVDDPYWARFDGYPGHGTFNTFLDALDGSYCNYSAFGETGDNPNVDPIYPDKHKHGYKHQHMCGVFKPAKVISFSYGREDDSFPEAYTRRQCNEWLKLSLQGTTFVRASGDEGVGGSVRSLHPPKTSCGGKHHKRFDISGTDGCPALLSVGGTMIAKGNTVKDPEIAMAFPKALFWSTGGFSNIFKRPKYQDEAISSYFKNHKPRYRSYAHIGLKGLDKVRGRYNRIGRGVPDVSAAGMHFAGFTHDHPYNSGGTSGSSPLFAALLARINDERLRRGKSTVGFVNPVLYKHPEIFNDITNGTNPGCGTEGFTAVKGWDPVTGLGTPNYPRMLKLFLSLP